MISFACFLLMIGFSWFLVIITNFLNIFLLIFLLFAFLPLLLFYNISIYYIILFNLLFLLLLILLLLILLLFLIIILLLRFPLIKMVTNRWLIKSKQYSYSHIHPINRHIILPTSNHETTSWQIFPTLSTLANLPTINPPCIPNLFIIPRFRSTHRIYCCFINSLIRYSLPFQWVLYHCTPSSMNISM